MPLDDRDRSFEKALAIRLRANMPASDCPDAETLAAYHERSLTHDELTSWKSHIASCTNCQQILAHLETLDEVPLGTASAPAAALKSAGVVSIAKIPKQQDSKHWRWIAPLGAVAAGFIVWVAVHDNRPSAVLSPAKIEIAQNRSSETASKLAAPAPAAREKLDTTRSLSKSVPSAGDRASPSSAMQDRRDILLPKAAPSAPLAGRSKAVATESDSAEFAAKAPSTQDRKISGVAGGIATDAAGAAVGGIATAKKEKKFDEPAQQDEAMNYVATPAVPKPQAAKESGVPSQQKDEQQLQARQTAGVPAPPQAEAKQAPQISDALAAKPQALAETVTSGAAATPAMRMAKSRAPRTVAAPGGKVTWRLGVGGYIEKSLDGGQTWTLQTSGTTENLFLGSAPSEQVCWVISSSGTILRTTDGGATWLPVVSPIPQNLGLIRASDGLHATVWDMSRRNIFQTSDGGVTWSPAPAH